MCGIAGFHGPGSAEDLERMLAALRHRGPDAHGRLADEALAVRLGHRRLVVLDPAGGAQPMASADGQIVVVFNGEIYNHRALRRELERRGFVFRSDHSDTEVLVQGYAAWGEGLIERLNGQFAFAILDRRHRRLVLARDRFGEKPLYYAHAPGRLAFASEASALARHPAVGRALDPLAVHRYFAWGYVPAPGALFVGMAKLPPGGIARYGLDDGRLEVRRYWQFHVEPDERLAAHGEAALAEELEALLARAVRRRLEADVPLGVFLSGGIDSSTVLALAARERDPAGLETFTIGFREASYDESAYAAAVAQALGVDHHLRILEADAAARLIPQLLPRLDEPLADPSILPTHLLAAFARERVTVALTGDGGDELLAGYDPFLALAPARWYRRLVPPALHRLLARAVQHLPRSERNMSLDFRLRRALAGLDHPPALWNPVWLAPATPRELAAIAAEPCPPEVLYADAIEAWESCPSPDPVDRTLEFYTRFYLPEDILMKTDRAAMQVSLEARAVFLDNDVVDFCRRLPARFKLRRGVRKWLLRRAMAGALPRAVTRRPKKGFGIPAARWLRTLPLAPPAVEIPGVDRRVLERCWGAHRAGRADHRLLLWAWLTLGMVAAGGAGALEEAA